MIYNSWCKFLLEPAELNFNTYSVIQVGILTLASGIQEWLVVLINFIITYFFAVKSETSNKKEEEKNVENTDTKWVSNLKLFSTSSNNLRIVKFRIVSLLWPQITSSMKNLTFKNNIDVTVENHL